MFRKQTTLILGAGASKPYGFPLGYQLIDDIIHCIKNDTVLFPFNRQNRDAFTKTGASLSLSDYSLFLDHSNILPIIRQSIRNGKIERILQARSPCMDFSEKHIDGIVYGDLGPEKLMIVKLHYIKELAQLAQMLEDFDPVSIDAFLRDHPEHKIAGQTMILYCLIKCHNSGKYKKNPPDSSLDNEAVCELKKNKVVQDNWYRYLLNDIKSGCQNPSDLLQNKLSVVTFNYDVSIDFYLKDKLSKTSFFSDYAKQYLEQLTINHVYGSICEFEEIEDFYDLKQNNLTELGQNIINFHHLLYGYLQSIAETPRIKLMGDRTIDPQIKERIQFADTVILIGFSFDPDNLSVLGFPNNKADYGDFLLAKEIGGIPTHKKIYYLDYLGRMQSLNNEFVQLETFLKEKNHGHSHLTITRSTAGTISDAYVNDFRESLFM